MLIIALLAVVFLICWCIGVITITMYFITLIQLKKHLAKHAPSILRDKYASRVSWGNPSRMLSAFKSFGDKESLMHILAARFDVNTIFNSSDEHAQNLCQKLLKLLSIQIRVLIIGFSSVAIAFFMSILF